MKPETQRTIQRLERLNRRLKWFGIIMLTLMIGGLAVEFLSYCC